MTTKTAEASLKVDELEVWCSEHQGRMKNVVGENIVHGWYVCHKGAYDHSVVISDALESKTTTSDEEGRAVPKERER